MNCRVLLICNESMNVSKQRERKIEFLKKNFTSDKFLIFYSLSHSIEVFSSLYIFYYYVIYY